MRWLHHDPPTAAQLESDLGYPPGTITFERPTGQPGPDDPYKILATVEGDGLPGWRVTLEEAQP